MCSSETCANSATALPVPEKYLATVACDNSNPSFNVLMNSVGAPAGFAKRPMNQIDNFPRHGGSPRMATLHL